MTEIFDVAVIGAGFAGSAGAIAAARQGAAVCLVGEASAACGRTESLDPDCLQTLGELGGPGKSVRAWFPGTICEAGPRQFSPSWGGLRMGAHVDRDVLEQHLTHTAARAGAVRFEATVMSVRAAPFCFFLSCDSRPEIRARRVVLATGRRVGLARQLGAGRQVLSRPLLVASGTLPSSSPAGVPARFRLTEAGWRWSAFLGGGVAAWTELAAAGTRRASALAAAGRVTGVTWVRATAGAGPGWLLAGDAACALDPSWGRGILFALRTGTYAGKLSAFCASASASAAQIERAYGHAVVATAASESASLARVTG